MKTPEHVLKGLGKAIADGDAEAFAALCTEHQNTIRDQFEDWARVADDLDDPEAREVIATCLELIATTFADAGIPELLETLGQRRGGDTVH